MRAHLYLIMFSLVLGVAVGAVTQCAHDYFQKGLRAGYTGDLKGALWNYDVAVLLNPKAANALTNRGNVRADLGDPLGALKDYDSVIRMDPTDHIAIANRGCVYTEIGLFGKALQDFNRALELNPNSEPALVGRGYCADELGDLAGALRDYDCAIQLNSKDDRAYYNRAGVRARTGDLKGSLDDFERSIYLNPKCGLAYFNYGVNLSDLGRYAEAVESFGNAIELDSKNEPSYRYYRALAELEIGLRREAQNDLVRALELEPNFSMARQKLCAEFEVSHSKSFRVEGLPQVHPRRSHSCHSTPLILILFPLASMTFFIIVCRRIILWKLKKKKIIARD